METLLSPSEFRGRAGDALPDLKTSTKAGYRVFPPSAGGDRVFRSRVRPARYFIRRALNQRPTSSHRARYSPGRATELSASRQPPAQSLERREHDVPEADLAVVALEEERPGLILVGAERTAG